MTNHSPIPIPEPVGSMPDIPTTPNAEELSSHASAGGVTEIGSARSSPALWRTVRRSAVREVVEQPLLVLMGTLIVALLGIAFVNLNNSVGLLDSRIDRVEVRIDRLEDNLSSRFAAQDAEFETKFAELDAKFEAKFDEFEAKFDEFEAKFDELDAKFEAKFEVLDGKIDELNLKMTALIAALNATTQVEAALDGKLLNPESEPAPSSEDNNP